MVWRSVPSDRAHSDRVVALGDRVIAGEVVTRFGDSGAIATGHLIARLTLRHGARKRLTQETDGT